MLDWIMKNKEWLFSGVAVAILVPVIGLFWIEGSDPPLGVPDNSVHQTHSGSGDNVGGNKNVTTDNSVRQISTGSGDNVARDKIIHKHLYGSVDYQDLVKEIKEAEELLAGIAPDRIDLRLKQSAKMGELKQRLEDVEADVFRLHELFTRIPINTERLRRAKEHFDKGEFRKADAMLKAEDIKREVDRLKKKKKATIERNLKKRVQKVPHKAQPSLVTLVNEGEDRFKRTEEYFEQVPSSYSIIVRTSAGVILKWQEPRAGRMMTWAEANEYVDQSNQNWLMNHDEWRLPSVGELQELEKIIKDYPDIFSDIDQLYWSSEDIGAVKATVVNLGNAQMEWYDVDIQVVTRNKNSKFSVRLVRTMKSGTTTDP